MAEETPKNPTIGSLIKDLAKDLIRSKKFAALMAGVVANLVVLGASKFGVDEATAAEVATKVTGIVGAYLIGQGLADSGKEQAKIEVNSEASKPAAPVAEPEPKTTA